MHLISRSLTSLPSETLEIRSISHNVFILKIPSPVLPRIPYVILIRDIPKVRRGLTLVSQVFIDDGYTEICRRLHLTIQDFDGIEFRLPKSDHVQYLITIHPLVRKKADLQPRLDTRSRYASNRPWTRICAPMARDADSTRLETGDRRLLQAGRHQL